MDNYLLNGHIMQCKVIPKDKVHPQLWVGANRKWRTVPRDQLAKAQHNKVHTTANLQLLDSGELMFCVSSQKRTEEEREAASKRLLRKQNQKKRKLEELGINYDIDSVGYVCLVPINSYSLFSHLIPFRKKLQRRHSRVDQSHSRTSLTYIPSLQPVSLTVLSRPTAPYST